MKINSLTFGEIELREDTIYEFPKGIPGLGGIRRFALLDFEDTAPFKWLQACEEPFVSLMMLDPNVILPEYAITVDDAYMKMLRLKTEEDAALLTIVSVPTEANRMTANLLAPVVFNFRDRVAMQVVVEGPPDWLRVPVFQQ